MVKTFTRILIAVLSPLLSVIPLRAQLVINEYSCANLTSVPDNYSEYHDWVELYNAGASSVNLNTYCLSDNAANPTKWTFPSGTVASHGYVQVICSGRNVVSGNWYHTNFSLIQCKGEKIILANTGGTILDSLTVKRNQADDSWGRTTDGASTWSVFLTPTFNASNGSGTAYSPYATMPNFSLTPGYYSGTQTLTISSPDPNVTIHYTTNGFDPTISDPVYSAPLSISSTQVVRACAFSSTSTVPPSFIRSASYFINVSVHTLATVSVYGDNLMTLMQGSWSATPATSLEYFDKGGVQRCVVSGTSNKHGNDSWSYDQRGIDFESVDEFGYDYALNWKLFTRTPRQHFSKVIIKAAANDNYPFETGGAHLRDAYCHTLSQDARLHLDERTAEFCEMYVNGQYWGVYDLREKADDKDYTAYYYGQDEPNIQMMKTWGGTWAEYGGAQTISDWSTIQTYIVNNNMAVPANFAHMDSIYNWKSLADYIILNSICVTSDWLNWNTEWWRGLDTTGSSKKWRYTLWDNDATFGHYINYTGIPDTSPSADPCNPESLPDPGGEGHIPIVNALMASPTFKQYYISRFADLMNTSMSCDSLIDLLDTMSGQIAPQMPAQVARWGGSLGGWQTNVTAMRTFIQTRCVALQQGMVSCYNLTGPYNVIIEVQPVGAGTVDCNSLHLDAFPWNGMYYGGIPIILQTAPTSSMYTFDHWEMTAVPTPSSTADSVNINITGAEHIIAVYKKNEILSNVFVPNAFSPNNDGQNDMFFIHGLDPAQSAEVAIFNRWGQQVFDSKDMTTGWDGTMGGKLCPSGVYAYFLKATNPDGTSETKSGNITLMR